MTPANPPSAPDPAPRLGLGGSQLGSMFAPVDDGQADRTLAAAYERGIRLFDTAPFYGRGLSEVRFGRFLRTRPRDEFVLSTKVGRCLFPASGPFVRGPGTVGALANDFRFDYSYDGIMLSHRQSLERLGMDRIDWLLIHDLDPVMHPPAELSRHFADLQASGFRALRELRASGRVRAVGAGVNCAGMTRRFFEHFDLDVVLLALSCNLLDRSALDDDLPLCAERGVAVIAGAPFASGLLASGTGQAGTYRYAPAGPEVLARLREIESRCAEHRVPLRAAALQFPLRHEPVTRVVAGMLDPAQIDDNLAMLDHPIPDGFWSGL